MKQTLVSAFANVAEKPPVRIEHENESAFGVRDVNVVGSIHRNPIRQPKTATGAPSDAEGVATPEDVHSTDVRVNNEEASAGVNSNAMGCQKNSLPSVGQRNNVIAKNCQQRLPSYRFHSVGRRFIVLFDTLSGMKIDKRRNLAGPRPNPRGTGERAPASNAVMID
jgi:hypothetical protein